MPNYLAAPTSASFASAYRNLRTIRSGECLLLLPKLIRDCWTFGVAGQVYGEQVSCRKV